ncbi:MAG: hypothetical protein DRI61_16500 [Chloroflexi bacterium]|nr:MAG: hypothetical protein DRI61_16500 [Chloroflexota bacterium]
MAYNTISLISEGAVQKEALASGSITPGMLLEQTSAAAATVKAHATAGDIAQAAFAVEDDLQGNGIDTVYATTKRVLYKVFRPGDEVYAVLKNGQNIAIGDKLVSAGDGTLKKRTYPADSSAVVQEEHVVGYARNANDRSSSSSAIDAAESNRIIVEIC